MQNLGANRVYYGEFENTELIYSLQNVYPTVDLAEARGDT